MPEIPELVHLLRQAKVLGAQYRKLTGKPLGVTGEVAEYEAARLLGLDLLGAREPGTDATGPDGRKFQVKGRVLQEGTENGRIGSLNFSHPWDACLYVEMTPTLEAIGIWQADRAALQAACAAPGSKARNERFALPINVFKRVGKQIWPS